jgi:predicted lipoprotein with Yx(FWY)xxD motif
LLDQARTSLAVVTALLALGLALALAGATSAATGARPTVKLVRTSLGKILVDGSGYTLYLFTRDRRRQDRCVGVPGCIGVWPALTSARRPVAGPGVKSSLLGTIRYHGSVRQVTYAGHPLYTYAGDFAPRSTAYAGTYEYGGTWYAVGAAGKAIHTGGL